MGNIRPTSGKNPRREVGGMSAREIMPFFAATQEEVTMKKNVFLGALAGAALVGTVAGGGAAGDEMGGGENLTPLTQRNLMPAFSF